MIEAFQISTRTEKRAGAARPKPDPVEFFTPAPLLDHVRLYFGGQIPLDPATSPGNPTTAARLFTVAEDGLAQSWSLQAFVNPPGGRLLERWVRKIGQEVRTGVEVISLLPANATLGNRYLQDALLVPQLRALCWVRKKIKFLDATGRAVDYRYATMLLGHNVDATRFRAAFESLGRVVEMKLLGRGEQEVGHAP